MKIYKISPILSHSPFFSLTYVSSHDFKVSDVVEIDFNKRKIYGVVEEKYDVKDGKVEIRKSGFLTKKIENGEVLRGENGSAIFASKQYECLKNFADYFLIPVGEIIYYLFGEEVDVKKNVFEKIFSFTYDKEENLEINILDFSFEKYTLLINPHISRLHLLFVYLENFFTPPTGSGDKKNSKKIVIKIGSSFLGTAELFFLENLKKNKKFKIEILENKHVAKKYFVKADKEEIINKEVLEKIKPLSVAGDIKTFVFVLSRAYADRIYCKDCSSQYDCTNCGHGYSVLVEENEKFLYCKNCFDQKILKDDQYLICKKCGSWAVFPFGTGIQKVKEFLIENNLEADLKNKNIVVGGVKELNKIISPPTRSGVAKKMEKFKNVVVASLGPLVKGNTFDSDEKLIYLLSKLENIGNNLYINKREGDEISLDNFKNKNEFILRELDLRKELNLPPYTKIVSIIFPYKNKKIIDKIILENLDLLKNYFSINKKNNYIYYWNVSIGENLNIFKIFRNCADVYVGNAIITNTIKTK